jgi:hypothetical protein
MPEDTKRPEPRASRSYIAGRIVDYDEQSGVAVFRVEKTSRSKDVLKAHAQQHRGLFVYWRSFAERPKLGTLINVARYEQPAINRGAAAIELQREEGRTFIVARYGGDPSKLPQGVWFSDGKGIKRRGEERTAHPLESREDRKVRSSSPIYLVIERTEIPHLGHVVGSFDSKSQARERASELQARLVQKQKAGRPEPSRDDPSQGPRSNHEWWRSEGLALRERQQQDHEPSRSRSTSRPSMTGAVDRHMAKKEPPWRGRGTRKSKRSPSERTVMILP